MSFHSGANTSGGQIHGVHVDDDDKKNWECLDPAFFNKPHHVGMTQPNIVVRVCLRNSMR